MTDSILIFGVTFLVAYTLLGGFEQKPVEYPYYDADTGKCVVKDGDVISRYSAHKLECVN